ncbi:hypothetical protein ACLMJK_008429 [Lecanora helva]
MTESESKKSFLSRLCSKIFRKPTPPVTKSKIPRRSFAIGTKVVNLNEVGADGEPTNDLRFVRDARYSEPQKEWQYQLNGKNYKNNDGWVAEGMLRRYPQQS